MATTGTGCGHRIGQLTDGAVCTGCIEDEREAARQDGYRLALADVREQVKTLTRYRDVQDSHGYYPAPDVHRLLDAIARFREGSNGR